MKRSLTLKRDALAPLTTGELHGVNGAAGAITGQGFTCPFAECTKLGSYVGHCPTLPECP